MAEPVRRISLPSAGWWEILTRPKWKHLRQWTLLLHGQAGHGLMKHALVSLTTGWSFPEEISLEALAQRAPQDVIAVLKVFQQEASPILETSDNRKMAEELFAGLAAGKVPARFAEVHLMSATGWSWQVLQETPADVIQKMAIYLAVRQARDTGGSLEFGIAGEIGNGK